MARRGKGSFDIPREQDFPNLMEFIAAWNAFATGCGWSSDHQLDAELKRLMYQDLFDISPLDPDRINSLDTDAIIQMAKQIQLNLVERQRVLVTVIHIFDCFFHKPVLAPAVLVALLAKTTGRYAALEWLCQLAGCRLVVPTTPDREGAGE